MSVIYSALGHARNHLTALYKSKLCKLKLMLRVALHEQVLGFRQDCERQDEECEERTILKTCFVVAISCNADAIHCARLLAKTERQFFNCRASIDYKLY